MKKVSLVVMGRERNDSLRKLRDAGVVHLKGRGVSSALLKDLSERRERNKWALGFLSTYHFKDDMPAPPVDYTPPVDTAGHIKGLVAEKENLTEQLAHFIGEKRRLESWGNIDPHDFAILRQHGIKFFLYQLPRQILKKVSDKTKYILLSQDKQWAKIVVLDAEIPGMHPVKLPALSISGMDNRAETIHKRIAGIETELSNLAHHKPTIEAENAHLLEEIEFETARVGMETIEGVPPRLAIFWLTGFVPGEKADVVKKLAEENGWPLVLSDPSPEDRPPTLLRNNPFVRIVQPLFSMLGTLPGYREFDISLSYMVFLSIFFSMILGDAAYGLILLGIGAAAGIALKKKNGVFPDAAKLLALFSSCAVVWGSLTGSWFAVPIEKLPPVLRSLVIPPFNGSGPLAEFPPFMQSVFGLPEKVPVDDLKTKWNIQFLCFTVAVVQLVWARSKNIRKLLPSLTALAQFGWMIAMIGLYFVVLSMLLKITLQPFATWLIIAGIALNLVFGEQNGGNFFLNILKSFSNFFTIFLKAVGGFADIVSYIRLFAAGLAGNMIAGIFNTMAVPAEGFGNFGLVFILRLLVATLVLIAGHSLNVMMCALSMIVHGVRLNLLEYAGNHLGMDWSGYAYKPFALKHKAKGSEEAL